MNVGNRVIYGLQTPKMFGNFSKSHYLYFMHLSTFSSKKGSVGFTGISMGSKAHKR